MEKTNKKRTCKKDLLEILTCRDPFSRQSWLILKLADLGKMELGTFVSFCRLERD